MRYKNKEQAYRILILTTCLALLTLSYQNCGSPEVSFESIKATEIDPEILDRDRNNPQPNKEEVDKELEQIKKDCQSKQVKTMTFDVSFAATSADSFTCEWGINGNLEAKNGYLQARYEQAMRINMPSNSKVCDMAFNFPEQAMKYDDLFLITLDERIIATAYDWQNILELDDFGYMKYNWQLMAGSVWDNSKEGTFCAGLSDGKSSCSWPVTDTNGTIKLDYNTEVIQQIMAQGLSKSNHDFRFVTIGDDDTGDCEHSRIDFQVEVSYVE